MITMSTLLLEIVVEHGSIVGARHSEWPGPCITVENVRKSLSPEEPYHSFMIDPARAGSR